MSLLKEYKRASHEYFQIEKEFHEQLKPYKEKVNRLRDELELTILKDSIYLPYEDLVKFSGRIGRVNMIVQSETGYQRIEKLLFNGFTLKDGKIIDTSMYPPRFKWVKDNIYMDTSFSTESGNPEVQVLGCYNLELDGVPIFDSQLEVLWKEK